MFSSNKIFVTALMAITLTAHTIEPHSAKSEKSRPTSEEYAFDHVMHMKMTEKDKKGKEKNNMEMELFFSDKTPHIGFQMEMEGIEAFSVIDAEKQQMISLTNTGGMKMGMIFTIKDYNFEVDEEEEDFSDVNIKKTGRTKKVAGYNCVEWLMEDEDGSKTHLWMTQELKQDVFKTFGALNSVGRGMGRKMPIPDHLPQGFPMEVEQVEKNGVSYLMEVTKVEKNKPKSISTEGYKMMRM